MSIRFFLLGLIWLSFSQLVAQPSKPFYNFEYQARTGKVILKLDRFNEDFILVHYFASGIGSNDIGFDRGKIGGQKLVQFQRLGNKVLLVENNTRYRAESPLEAERKAVKDAFASSILFGFAIEKDTTDGVYIDLAPFLMEDQMGAATTLKDLKQGSYKTDKLRCAVLPESLLAFPKNVEFEAWLTLAGEAGGDQIKTVTPTPELVSYRQHTSFVALPEAGYQPRKYHPFSGYFDLSYNDYASPIHEPIEKKFIMRHRLEKKFPDKEKSEAIEPIIYYVDNGCPEPIKTALIEGAAWWNEAFEAAGFINAFQVKELPADAHPLDVRYNTIQWVHRSTRGWSYGNSVYDPRTGEIIKGHVSLGSLRVRQDFMIAQGLLSLYKGGKEDHGPMTALSLARLRQLSAHEVGHTLGLAHNFAASINDRASVMDYPHPLVTVATNGSINMDKAYDNKIGIWDKRAIVYGYSTTNTPKALQKIIADTKSLGLKYLSDPDARPDGSAHAEAHLWDNGTNAVAELERIMQLRQTSLARFGENSLATGQPFSELEKILVPVYHMQRYQVEAVAKWIAGYTYGYDVKGEDAPGSSKVVGLDEQKQAIAALASTLTPEQLKLPAHLFNLIPPHAYGYDATRESMKAETGYGLDQNAAATATIDHVLSLLLHPQRLARIQNPGQMGLNAYLAEINKNLTTQNLPSPTDLDYLRERRWFIRLVALASNPRQANIATEAFDLVRTLKKFWARTHGDDIHHRYLIYLAEKLEANELPELPSPLSLPPGAPIGCE
ncbi:MAG: zinc-dependent metalloprotease [Saprospiraceae bacterium]|nr:zinc-dependent metalloprotease [Saprospiraceae bacterium]MBK8109032.1 zinc-dependent metalloprotease [Saprospiraceae bacterium]MBK9686936.1 zinc-dependent metalloprotease [Saprospiraceae bacterium]